MDRLNLPADSRSLFERLMDEPLASPDELREAVRDGARSFGESVRANDFVDPEDVKALVHSCLGLIDELQNMDDEEEQRLVQAAVQYFVMEDDGDDDRGIGGLDDDIQVVNAVATRLELDELLIQR